MQDDQQDELAWTHHIIEMIAHQGNGAGAETELDPVTTLNHVWMEPPLQHEDTGRARHRGWNGRDTP